MYAWLMWMYAQEEAAGSALMPEALGFYQGTRGREDVSDTVREAALMDALKAVGAVLAQAEAWREALITDAALNTRWGARTISQHSGMPEATVGRRIARWR